MIQKTFRNIALASVIVMSLFVTSLHHLKADAVPADLIISQIKVNTSSQFVTLYNNTNQTIDMTSVSLQYFNNYQLSAVTTSKSIQLSGMLAAHSYYLINDGPITLCYQTMVQSASLSFSSKAGMVEVVRLAQQSSGNVGLVAQDFVRWSSTNVSGVQTMPVEPTLFAASTFEWSTGG